MCSESSPEVSVGGGPGVAQKLYLRGLEDTLLNVTSMAPTSRARPFTIPAVSVSSRSFSSVPRSSRGPATQRLGRVRWEARFVSSPKTGRSAARRRARRGAGQGSYFSNAEGFKSSNSLYGRLDDVWSAMAVVTYGTRTTTGMAMAERPRYRCSATTGVRQGGRSADR